jgi:hypothetical protein
MTPSSATGNDWIPLSMAVARMGELHPIYRRYPGWARRDLDNTIRAGRALLRGRPPDAADRAPPTIISGPISGRHKLDLHHNVLTLRTRPGPLGMETITRDVHIEWTSVEGYLRKSAAGYGCPVFPVEQLSSDADLPQGPPVPTEGQTVIHPSDDDGEAFGGADAKAETDRGHLPSGDPNRLQTATDTQIDQAINAVYEDYEHRNEKPPNVKELVQPVQHKLRDIDLDASGREIQKRAKAFEHCRWKQGATQAQKRRQQDRKISDK